MAIYYMTLVYILTMGVFFYRVSEIRWGKRIILLLSFVDLFLLMAVRAETVGKDIYIYREKFRIIARADTWKEITETVEGAPVYGILCKIVSLFGDYRLMLIITAFIITGSVALYIYYFSDNAVVSVYCYVTLFFYLHTYNLSRQFLAVALFLLALCCRKKKVFVLSIVFFLLAAGIHNLTVIALPLLIIDQNKIITKKFYMYMAVTSAAVLLFSIGFTKIIGVFSVLFPRYQVYLQGGEFSVYNKSGGSVMFLALFYFLVAIMAVILQSNILKGINIEDVECSHLRYLTIAVTAGALMGILSGSFEAMSRALYFYQIHSICLIPNAFGKFRRYRFYYPVYFALLLILLAPFIVCLIKNFGEVVPYIPMWKER